MTHAYICDAIRTPFGRYGGALSSVRTDDLGAMPIRALMQRHGDVDWSTLDDVIYGCANGAGEDNRNVARMASLLREVASAMDLPVDDIVPDEDGMAKRRSEQQAAMQQQQDAAMQAEDAKAERAAKVEAAKGEAKSSADMQQRTLEIIGDIVRQAVTQAVAGERAKGPKKLKFGKGADGLIETAEVDEGNEQ